HRGIHSGKGRNEFIQCAHPARAMARGAVLPDGGAILGVSGSNLIERFGGPSDQCRRAQRWLRRARRSDIGTNADAAADCGPEAKWLSILPKGANDDEAENERDDQDHRRRLPTASLPGMAETEQSPVLRRGLA